MLQLCTETENNYLQILDLEIIPHDQGQLPDAGVGLGGARRDHAVVEYLEIKEYKNA